MKKTNTTLKDTKKKKLFNKKYILYWVVILVWLWILDFVLTNYWNGNDSQWGWVILSKPIIYLYPEETMDIFVWLDFEWKIIADYPKINENIGGWNVKATPESELINLSDNKEYSYIFWEWIPDEEINWDLTTWFVVPGNETVSFLQDILPEMGLTPREYNEFIVFWFPLLQNNSYNLIHFSDTQYTDIAPLTTVPNYDSLLRVFMVAKALDEPIEVIPQTFQWFERNGFSVVEWWGVIIE